MADPSVPFEERDITFRIKDCDSHEFYRKLILTINETTPMSFVGTHIPYGGWFSAKIVTLFDVHGDLQASMHLAAQLAENEPLNAPAVRTLRITPATACVDIYVEPASLIVMEHFLVLLAADDGYLVFRVVFLCSFQGANTRHHSLHCAPDLSLRW